MQAAWRVDRSNRAGWPKTALIRAGSAGRVDTAYTRPLDGSGLIVECYSLLPLDLHRFSGAAENRSPLVQLPPAQLLQQLRSNTCAPN